MTVQLDQLKQNKALSKKDYERELEKYQRRLLALQQMMFQEKIALVIVFEGMDAAGKGGAIKRMNEKLDPRGVVVHPISAPAPHEKRYHYMQRFWRKIPQYGQIGIFDRSWYGRVLVERVEKFASKNEWQRAYDEINSFEQSLTDSRYIVAKFWLHISKDEQLRRFEDRQLNPIKRWKITDEDWRNRKKWDLYVDAAEEMFAKTSVPAAPWYIIEANDKKYARIEILKQLVHHVEKQLKKWGEPLPEYELFDAT